MWKSTLVFFAIIGVSLAALSFGNLQPKPEKYKDVEGCYIKELDIVIPYGKSEPSKAECMEYRCEGDLTYASCGVVLTTTPCELVTDLTKPYPHCCPQTVCP